MLHWLIAALIVVQASLGLIGLELPLGMEKLATLARHKSIGITILALAAMRLLWRWMNPAPALPGDLRRCERFLAGEYRRGDESWPIFDLFGFVESNLFLQAADE